MKYLKVVLVVILALGLSACGKKEVENDNTDGKEKIVLGICAGPYGDLFKQAIAPELEKKGYDEVKYVEFSDYVQPNLALADNETNVNLFQHSIYLKNFNKEHNLKLSPVVEVPTASMGVFSESVKDLSKLKEGAKIAIPNDETNLARALRVLQQAKVIELDASVDASKAQVKDIASNPKNVTFEEVSAEILPTVLDSTDAAVINGNYAISAGLNLGDAIYVEELSEGYFNVIAVRTEDLDKTWVKDIKNIVHSDAFRKVVEDKDNIFYSFQKPKDYDK